MVVAVPGMGEMDLELTSRKSVSIRSRNRGENGWFIAARIKWRSHATRISTGRRIGVKPHLNDIVSRA